MASIGYVNISNAIQDWIEDSGVIDYQELNETLLVKWATDAVNMVSFPEAKLHKIAILPVENYKARIPDDFTLLQAASGWDWTKEKTKCERTRELQITQWLQNAGKDCHLEINLVCDRCGEAPCGCGSPVVEVDINRIREQTLPHIYYNNYMYRNLVGYGSSIAKNKISEKFQLMKYATNDYFQVEKFLGDCPNVYCKDCPLVFRVEMPWINVNFERGEILFSYLARPTDENGDIMIPDHVDMHQAIGYHIDYKYFKREAKRNRYNPKKSGVDFSLAQEAKSMREDALGKFRTAVTIPDIHDFKSWLEQSWLSRIPNAKRKDNLNAEPEMQYERYGKAIDVRLDHKTIY